MTCAESDIASPILMDERTFREADDFSSGIQVQSRIEVRQLRGARSSSPVEPCVNPEVSREA